MDSPWLGMQGMRTQSQLSAKESRPESALDPTPGPGTPESHKTYSLAEAQGSGFSAPVWALVNQDAGVVHMSPFVLPRPSFLITPGFKHH